jgi:hypothetical protein
MNLVAQSHLPKRIRYTTSTSPGDQAGNPAFRRGHEATIAYLEGWLAEGNGDYTAARSIKSSTPKPPNISITAVR